MSEFKEQITKFIASHGLIGTAAGYCIGAVTKDAVSSLVVNVLFPLIFIGLGKMKIKNMDKYIKLNSKLDVLEFVKSIVTWIFIIIFTFIFIQVAFYQLLGVDPTKEKKKGEPVAL